MESKAIQMKLNNQNQPHRNKFLLITAAVAALHTSHQLFGAATRTWDGGASTLSFNDPANWSADTKPGTTDTAVFTDAGFGADADYAIDLGGDQTVRVLRFGTTGATPAALTK